MIIECSETAQGMPSPPSLSGTPPSIAKTPDYQMRVISEKLKLDEMLKDLILFIEGPGQFQRQSDEEKHRLRAQATVMRQYSSILADRIAAFGARPL